MRDYDLQPDANHMMHSHQRAQAGVQRVLGVVERNHGEVSTSAAGNMASTLWELLSAGWGTGRPLDELRDSVQLGLPVMHKGMQAGIDPTHYRTDMIARVVMAVGDRAGSEWVSHHTLALPLESPPNDTIHHAYNAIAAAVVDPDNVQAHLDAFRANMNSAATPPDIEEEMRGLDDMLQAVVDRDQDGFDEACALRARTQTALCDVSDKMRRRLDAVFDYNGVKVCRLAHVAGLDLPEHPLFARELLLEL